MARRGSKGSTGAAADRLLANSAGLSHAFPGVTGAREIPSGYGRPAAARFLPHPSAPAEASIGACWGYAVNRSDWIVLLLARDELHVDGPESLDPVRIQKGMFLLSEIGPAKALYSFRPYNWGPFSSDIYGDLDGLVRSGLVSQDTAPGRTWARYSLTESGRTAAHEIAEAAGNETVTWIGDMRRFLTERSFAQLLNDVYARFPDMATRSQFRA